jgi:hypothetical protein
MVGFDISNAFVNAPIPDGQRVICKLPKHWGGDYVILRKSLYGLRQAPRNWFDHFKDALVGDLGWEQSEHDDGLFRKWVQGELLTLCIYVDDGMIHGPRELILAEREKVLSRFKGRREEPEIVDGWEVRTVLGVKISYHPATHQLKFSQTHAVEKVLDRFGMSDCKTARTPGSSFTNEGKLVDSNLYRQMVGSCMYIATQTRVDISQTVQQLSRYLCEPRQSALSAVKRLMRYLKGTKELTIFYDPEFSIKLTEKYSKMLPRDSSSTTDILGFADADFAPAHTERRSTSGNLFLYHGVPVHWTSGVQKCVAVSTAEAEYVSLFSLAKMSVSINNVVCFLTGRDEPLQIPILEDNAAAIQMARASITSRKSKHIDTKYHFTRDLWKRKRIEIAFCPTDDQLADPLTKFVPRACGLKLLTTGWLMDAGVVVTKSKQKKS